MTEIDNQVKDLVLGYFKHIHANIKEKNEIYDVILPENQYSLFRKSKITFTFNKNIEKPDDCELISPGNNTLFIILNECIKMGPILSVKLIHNDNTSYTKLRFYFYVIFESLKSKTSMHYVDVDVNSIKISFVENSEINFDENPQIQDILIDDIIDCYIEASNYIEKKIKPEILDFKNHIFQLKNEELEQIKSKYDKLRKKLEEESIELQSKSDSILAFQQIVDSHQILKQEEIQICKILEQKYTIHVDFALISALIIS